MVLNGHTGRGSFMRRPAFFLILTIALTFLYCDSAMAYIGPGAGITLLSAIWGVIVAFLLAISAVVFWPIRLILRRRRNRAAKRVSEKAEGVKSTPGNSD
jgi:hypothetical protein